MREFKTQPFGMILFWTATEEAPRAGPQLRERLSNSCRVSCISPAACGCGVNWILQVSFGRTGEGLAGKMIIGVCVQVTYPQGGIGLGLRQYGMGAREFVFVCIHSFLVDDP